jgi:hypothetical protein
MVVFNFTCLEKKAALENHQVHQTIRTSVAKFFRSEHIYLEFLKQLDKGETPHPMTIGGVTYLLHIWWNSRNFHVEDVCECGHRLSDHIGGPKMKKCMKCPYNPNDWKNIHPFKLKRQGLGKSQFLGMGEITSIVRKKVSEITEEDAIADGFKDKMIHHKTEFDSQQLAPVFPPFIQEAKVCCIQWLIKHNKNLTLESEVFIIQWR